MKIRHLLKFYPLYCYIFMVIVLKFALSEEFHSFLVISLMFFAIAAVIFIRSIIVYNKIEKLAKNDQSVSFECTRLIMKNDQYFGYFTMLHRIKVFMRLSKEEASVERKEIKATELIRRINNESVKIKILDS
jgi:ABC-type uncharacterized transport system fused permease/ATPase subunit